jgi:hypothetical protein
MAPSAASTATRTLEGVFRSSKVFHEIDNYRDTRRAIIDNKTKIGMSSLSETHDHDLMLAHYADQYREICIAYGSGVIAYFAAHNSASNRIFVRRVAVLRSSLRFSPGQRLSRDNPTKTFSTRGCT